jgi:phospholipid/cholesterol/gamma-HCH transport system substrate-binding protein
LTSNLGPGPVDQSETASAASPIGAQSGRDFGVRSYARPLAGLGTLLAIGAIVALAVALFRGSFIESVPLTVISDRAGLVMNPDAKVKMRDIQVGKVASIEELPTGQAALHLAMDPSQLNFIPSNVAVEIASSTVFGAKSVQLELPADPSSTPLRGGQTVEAEHVMVEANTLFDRLTTVLSKIKPDKLNATLGALASALNDRGERIGQSLTDFDNLLATMDPSLSTLSHELTVAPQVLHAYNNAAPDLVSTINSASTISQTIIDKQNDLDAFLVSTIGLADVGNQVVGDNRKGLTDVLHLLVPTTDLTNEYNLAINCGLSGVAVLGTGKPLEHPGTDALASFLWGTERYRYPDDLPKVAATGGPYCKEFQMPSVPYEGRPPFLITDTGAKPFPYGNQNWVWNSDALKQFLFGPIAGPPRNSSQIGQPG